MFGNTNQPLSTSWCGGFTCSRPMPDVIRDNMAFIDRLHYYLRGWEIPKMRNELFTDSLRVRCRLLGRGPGRVAELRRHNFIEVVDRHFSLGSYLNAGIVRPFGRRSPE